jgi:hypothetical protein
MSFYARAGFTLCSAVASCVGLALSVFAISPAHADSVATAEAACSVTVPGGTGIGNYGNDAMTVGLAPTGTYDALVFYEANHGNLSIKFPWVRLVAGRLRITARRLDAPAPPAVPRIPSGYGESTGFQASSVLFPTVGCWQVTGWVGTASLTFVIQIVGEVPVARAAIASVAVHRRTAVVRWTGNAAAVYYEVATRRPGGRWRWPGYRTTGTHYTVERLTADRVQVRVRALDKWFVAGPWSRAVRIAFAHR